MEMLQRFSQWLRARPLLVLPLFLAAYGIAWVDVADFRVLSSAPLTLTETRRQFLQYSPLSYILGYPLTHLLGASVSYGLIMAGGLVLAVAALRHLAASRYGSRQNDAMLMLFATPLLIVLTQYIGKSDPYIVAFLLLLIASRNPLVQGVLASLVVVSHLELGLIVLAAAMFLRLAPIRATALGGVVGASMVLGYIHFLLPAPPLSRAAIGGQLLGESIESVLSTPILHLVLSFGPFWVVVLSLPKVDWRWATALAGTAAMASSTLDFTRVFTLAGLPLIIATIDRVMADRPTTGLQHHAPRWLTLLPVSAFFQAHLISQNVYDSRIPQWIARVIDAMAR